MSDSKSSQIFCTHDWGMETDSKIEVCKLCGKKRELKSKEVREFSYDKNFHDRRYYFPNRCYGCEEYEHTTSDGGEPQSGTDPVYCNIGGTVLAEDGCINFRADVTAECKDCWNFSRGQNFLMADQCAIRGELEATMTGYCADYVAKERTDAEIPPDDDAISVSRAHKDIYKIPEGGTPTRIKILDAMQQYDIGMSSVYDHCCRTCKFEKNKIGELGYCNHHEISLLCYFGGMYDDKTCADYVRKESLPPDPFPKILALATTIGQYKLSPEFVLESNGTSYKIIFQSNGKLLYKPESYMLQSVQYNRDEECIDITYAGSRHIKIDPQTGETIPDNIADPDASWMDSVSSSEWDKAIRGVQTQQRAEGVYSGDKHRNCDECRHVERNSSYPDGSPTGLICSEKNINVTAQGCCDHFEKHRKYTTTKIAEAEARAEKEYLETHVQSMDRLKAIRSEIAELIKGPHSQSGYQQMLALNSEANDIVRAMNRITTDSEQVPFREIKKEISELLDIYTG